MKNTSSIWFKFVMVAALATFAVGLDSDASRIRSLATKMHCNCGCGDVLSECSHAECTRRGPLKQEIAAAIQLGKTDEQVLEAMGTRYGAMILLTPPFHGFDMLLWIVPIAGAVIGVVVFAWRFRPGKQ